MDRRLGGSHTQPEHSAEEEKNTISAGILTPVIQFVP
jgi:hypothetical protein